MKFYRAKNGGLICHFCKSNILYGEHYAWLFSYKAHRVFIFHIECYRKWEDNRFVNKYLEWKEALSHPRKRGRPVKSNNPREYRRLKAQLRYHQKAGNWDKVKELETEIKEMEVKE